MGNMNESYTVIISDRAADMLIQHVRFMAQISSSAADKLREEIVEAARSLEQLPERNSWFSDPMLPANKYRKMIISKRYILIDQIRDHIVYIEYILDCRQEYRWLL